MKRILILAVAMVFLLFPVAAMAAGTVADSDGKTLDENDWVKLGGGYWRIDVVWTDDGTGVSATIEVPESLYGGYVVKGVVDPGATAPTAAYDIEVLWHSIDVFAGGLHDLSATDNGDADYAIIAIADGDLTLVLTNNSVVGATGTLSIYISK